MKNIIFSIILVIACASPTLAASEVFQGVVPTPSLQAEDIKIIDSVKFTSPTAVIGSPCTVGSISMTSAYALVYCDASTLSWAYLKDIWTQNGHLIYLTDTSSPTLKKLGIGTSTPEFKMTLANDGGILATGAVGSGDALITSGNGARFIWYPKKGAIRGGVISGSGPLSGAEWNDVNIGQYSVAFGEDNAARGLNSVVAGGSGNEAGSGHFLSNANAVLGGVLNKATGVKSAVVGGHDNTASGAWSFVGGGTENTASGALATISGGGGWFARSAGPGNPIPNEASGWESTVGGGTGNRALGAASTVSGGELNDASNSASTAGGGIQNISSGFASTVAGGNNNQATGQTATVAGGDQNIASGAHSTVGGGSSNLASGANSTVIGGVSNVASGVASVASGQNTSTAGDLSFVGGVNMDLDANADATFVFGTAGSVETFSTPDTAVFWGVNLGVDVKDPATKLEVNGDIHSSKVAGKLIMVSPDGTCSACGPNDADIWTCASVICP